MSRLRRPPSDVPPYFRPACDVPSTRGSSIVLHVQPLEVTKRLRSAASTIARRKSWVPLAGLALAWLSWPIESLAPGTGLDASWEAALHLAAQERLRFGSEVVFTYGPLGFLTSPRLYFVPTAIAALLFLASIHAALCVIVVHHAVQRAGIVLGLALAFVAARIIAVLAGNDSSGSIVALALMLSMTALQRGAAGPAGYLPVAAAGALCGIALLIKLNTGLLVVGIAGVTVLACAARPLSALGLFLGLAFASALTAWSLTAGTLTDIPVFAAYSLQVIVGLSEAMGIEVPERRWEQAGAIVCAGVVGGLAFGEARRLPGYRRLALFVIGAATLFALLKYGFVRHDAHSVAFFATVFIASLAFRAEHWRGSLYLLALGALFVAVLGSSRASIGDLLDPRTSALKALEHASAMAVPSQRESIAALARAEMREAYGLDAEIVRVLSGRTLHVEPWEVGVAWAYPEVRWRPAPVFQAYVAYTDALDELNAAFFSSDRAPERILLGIGASIDGRYPAFESPAAKLAELCHYSSGGARGRWQLLERGPNRCGAPMLLGEVRARLSEPLAVPDAPVGSIVVARIDGVGVSLVDQLQTFLYKSPEYHARLNGERSIRLVPGTLVNPLLLRPAPRSVDPVALDIHTLEIVSGWRADALTIRFYAIPVSGLGLAPRDSEEFPRRSVEGQPMPR